MNTASHEIQLQLFDAPAVAQDFPEALVNRFGVLFGNVIVRKWSSGKDRLIITAGRQGNAWAAGIDLRWHHTGHCYAPDVGNLHYASADEAFKDRRLVVIRQLDKAAFFAQDEAGKRSASALLASLHGPYQEEIITNG